MSFSIESTICFRRYAGLREGRVLVAALSPQIGQRIHWLQLPPRILRVKEQWEAHLVHVVDQRDEPLARRASEDQPMLAGPARKCGDGSSQAEICLLPGPVTISPAA